MSDQTSVDERLATKNLPTAPILMALPNYAYEERIRRAQRLRFALFAGRAFGDSLLLIAAFIVAYWLRYGLELGRDVIAPESYKPISTFTPYIAAFTIMTLIAFQVRGLYSVPR